MDNKENIRKDYDDMENVKKDSGFSEEESMHIEEEHIDDTDDIELQFEEEKEEEEEKKGRSNILFVVILIGLLFVAGLFGWLWQQQKGIDKGMKKEIAEANRQVDSLATELENVKNDFRFLETSNDSLNGVLREYEDEIDQLLKKVKGLKYSNSATMRKYKTKIDFLNKQKEGYLAQIAKLKQQYQTLLDENIELRQQVETLKSQNIANNEVIERAAKISAIVKIDPLRKDKNGKKVYAQKIKKTKKFGVSVDLVPNELIPSGPKEVFVSILPPNSGKALNGGKSDPININGEMIDYTTIIQLDYDNVNGAKKTVDINLPSSSKARQKAGLKPGTYQIKVYTDGYQISSGKFKLK